MQHRLSTIAQAGCNAQVEYLLTRLSRVQRGMGIKRAEDLQ